MPKFLVQYVHVEETTYNQWIEADTEEEALSSIEEEADFSDVVNVQGIELKGFEILDEE